MENALYIYLQLRKAGTTHEGACGMLGNLQAESGIIPCRVEGDYLPPFEASRRYADEVDNGIKTRWIFSRDARGWGLAQWTYRPRKEALFDFCRERSISIANLEAQTDFLIRELKQDFRDVWNVLTTNHDLKACSDVVILKFENPADKSDGAKNTRFRMGYAISEKIQSAAATAATEEAKEETPPANSETPDTAETVHFPPRMLCFGMSGTDVKFLQAALNYRGYTVPETGFFNAETVKQLRSYQADTETLVVDGVAGEKTFAALTDFKERTFCHE
ncbi:MAG: peptidoglycan-binding protein [Oscillospiraceae bacterium]|nr:peptidoglycan-binding protein [Oscillospiraceae bacterium]